MARTPISWRDWCPTTCRAAARRSSSTVTGRSQQAFYVQDTSRLGQATVNAGLRARPLRGLRDEDPAAAAARRRRTRCPAAGTILRASYGRTLETPYNENLVLSSTADPAIFGTSGSRCRRAPAITSRAGVQQAFGGWVVVDVGYFYKHTTNAYDFGTLFDTPIFFRSPGTTRSSTA